MVPGTRLELVQCFAPRDFKSLASTSSATQAYRPLHIIFDPFLQPQFIRGGQIYLLSPAAFSVTYAAVMKNGNRKVILASKSPRRKELLEQTGIRFDILPADIDETLSCCPFAEDTVKMLSKTKARRIAEEHPYAAVIGADTIVTIDNKILGKPCSKAHASDMLNMLSNRSHTVYTGYTVCCLQSGLNITEAIATKVFFKKISPKELLFYINTDEPYDKAGGYGIQGIGAFLVKKIHGSYTNVVGLPVCEIMEIFIKEGIVALRETE